MRRNPLRKRIFAPTTLLAAIACLIVGTATVAQQPVGDDDLWSELTHAALKPEQVSPTDFLAIVPMRNEPICRWTGDGHSRDINREIDGQMVGGVEFRPAVVGHGFYFDGVDGAVRVPDHELLKLSDSFTITAWIKVLSYPSPRQELAHILFRGDDRSGQDPYALSVHADGMLSLLVNSGTSHTAVRVPIPLNEFVHVAASLDGNTGRMTIRFNGEVVAEATTQAFPFRDLDPGANPGIGIGNHASRPQSAFNQPFHGIIDELTISK